MCRWEMRDMPESMRAVADMLRRRIRDRSQGTVADDTSSEDAWHDDRDYDAIDEASCDDGYDETPRQSYATAWPTVDGSGRIVYVYDHQMAPREPPTSVVGKNRREISSTMRA